MINKLLIMILNHKKQKLVYKNCGICNYPLQCDYCDIYFMQRDIKDVVRHLKGGKI
jgi:hypothetical protein